ncbi:MAG: PIN domain-containing protein [Muribaculum sp.]|nr:PIN domain-containing protein [Muribaculum sp.]
MKYTRQQHKQFLDLELKTIAEKYRDILNTRASLLRDSNDIYVTQFIKIANEETNGGQMLLRFKKANGIPRKNEYFTAVILPADCCLPKQWGNLSWGELRMKQLEFSEVHCAWQGKEDNNGFLLCGFKGISVEMAEYLKTNPNCVIILGPQEPPIAYYQNLIDLLTIQDSVKMNKILDYSESDSKWSPISINSDFSSDNLLDLLDENKTLIVQGPPGTGKTFRIAQMVEILLKKDASVLVTALTNRALIEVVEKKNLKALVSSGKVSKTALTSDERAQVPGLMKAESGKIPSYKGQLILSTFYISSAWAKESFEESPFDYVIMDEASQALLAMIGGVTRLGKHILWIGDQNQLPPVINIGQDTITRYDYNDLVNGFATLAYNSDIKSFVLSDTFRLQHHAASLTSLFYDSGLNSCYNEQVYTNFSSFIEDGKDIVYLPYDFQTGDKFIEKQLDKILDIVGELLEKVPNSKIAVLTKFRVTVRSIQKAFISKYGYKENVLIDTVERVQGITRDFCLFVIPDVMRNMSLERRFFNVATSRATQATFIIGPQNILSSNCDERVRSYLSKLIFKDSESQNNNNLESCNSQQNEVKIQKPLITGVKVVGNIDLSQFERPKKELSKTKKNYYIIDTNIFVNYPDILSKIDVKYPIILSAKVVDELDKMKIKLSEQEKRNAEKALRLLNQDTKHQIIYQSADVSLLPDDFDKRSPDNMILSVALKFKDENPIMLTSDNGLQLKCKSQGIATVSLRDFLKR